ncbi:MAG: type II secretion system minor pseudopilin GspK [Succinivibrionaceae bacterium]
MVNKKGSALIMVLIVLAIAMVSTSSLITKYNRVQFVAHNSIMSRTSFWYVDGIEGIIKKYMKEDFKKSPSKVHMQMSWAQPNQVIPLDSAIISGSVYDEQACFNLNSINTKISTDLKPEEEHASFSESNYPYLVFKLLLEFMGADSTVSQTVADSMVDWIDANNELNTNYGAEDLYYSTLHTKHLTANNLFYDKSELRFIKGMDDELYRKIENMICALPHSKLEVNINMLTSRQAPLLYSLLLGEVDVQTLSDIIDKDRPAKGWDSTSDFLVLDQVKSRINYFSGLQPRLLKTLTVTSNYFIANIKVEYDEYQFMFKSRFYRNDANNIYVYQRTVGEFSE